MKNVRELLGIGIVLIIAGFLRFENLMFDAPFFFNPDERNMAIAITQLHIPDNLNPHFFAYGQFPLYLSFFSDQLGKLITQNIQRTEFLNAIFWLRFYSALSSTLTVLLTYLIAKELFKNRFAIVAAILVAFTPGLIQSAHFGTTESFLTFLFTSSVLVSLKMLKTKPRIKYIALLSMIIGVSIGTKLTGVICITPPLFALLIQGIQLIKEKKKIWVQILFKYTVIVIVLCIGSVLFTILASPYNLIAFNDFQSAVFGYEQDVATGVYKAFYTVQFEDTSPIIFQLQKVFPYTLGIPILLLGTLGFVLTIYKIFRGSTNSKLYALLILSFITYVIPNSFLFVKWTRFMTPILPFFSIFSTIFLYNIFTFKKKSGYIMILVILCCLIPGIAFASIYTNKDSRVTASDWIEKNIPNNKTILSETGNVIDIPLYPQTHNVISFDFYHIDENSELVEKLIQHLESSEYIFIPSRRIFTNYTRFPNKYPLLNKYYENLFSGSLGFKKVAEINSYPSIGPFIFNDENAEETWTVFDHPVIRIYKKTTQLSNEQLRSLLINKNDE